MSAVMGMRRYTKVVESLFDKNLQWFQWHPCDIASKAASTESSLEIFFQHHNNNV
jgi:hypothetical protein